MSLRGDQAPSSSATSVAEAPTNVLDEGEIQALIEEFAPAASPPE